jgi:hypothetical protein
MKAIAMPSNKRLRRRLQRLWEEDPHCHWCGKLTYMVLYPPGEEFMLKKQTSQMATIDHIYSRLHPKRLEAPRGERHEDLSRTVLACFQCNQERSRREQAELSPEEKLERSQRNRRKRKLQRGHPSHFADPPALDKVTKRIEFTDHESLNHDLGHLHRLLNHATNIIRDNGVLGKELTAEQEAEMQQVADQIRLSLLG